MNKDLERSHPGFVRVEEAPNVVLDQKHSGVVESKSVNDFIANKNTSNIIPNFFKRRYDDRCNSLVSNNNVFLTSQKLSLEIGDKSHTDCVSSNGSIRAVAPPFQPRGSLLTESSIQSTIRGLHLQFGFEQDLPVAFNMNECGNPTKDLNIDDIKDLNIDDLVFHARHPPKLLRSTASISPLPHHNEIELHKYPPSPFGGVAHPQMGDSPLRQKLSDVRLGPTHSPCLTNIESFVGKDDYIYYVRFKRTTRMHVLHPSAPLNIGVGDFVRVEADRGEDLGVVQTKVHVSEYRPEDPRTAGYRGRGFCSSHNEIKWLYRLATTTERLQIRDKVIEEQEALHVISSKIAQRHLPMEVIDAEVGNSIEGDGSTPFPLLVPRAVSGSLTS